MAERSGSDSVLRRFLGSEAAGGVLLILAAGLALAVGIWVSGTPITTSSMPRPARS